MEYNIFEIIKKEKKKISSLNIQNTNKLFCKYFFKYILDIKENFENIDIDLFNNEISKINVMLFNIFWIILLSCFNIHITIFFLERASLLFTEYIKLSTEKEESTEQLINQSIIFTYKKTIGDTSIENIIEENKKQQFSNEEKYKKILRVRDNTYIFIKILDSIIVKKYLDIDKYKKNNKSIINNLFNIYQNIENDKIDKYIFFKINKIFQDYNTEKALFIINIIIGIISELSDFDAEGLNFSVDVLENTIEFYESNNMFDNQPYNKIYLEVKKSIYRFIT